MTDVNKSSFTNDINELTSSIKSLNVGGGQNSDPLSSNTNLSPSKKSSPLKSSALRTERTEVKTAFSKKVFNSLGPHKISTKQTTINGLSKNDFFKPMPVKSKEWNKKLNIKELQSKETTTKIGNPDINSSGQTAKNVPIHDRWSKFAKHGSPIKDPYSSLYKDIDRSGSGFLDNPNKFKTEAELAKSLMSNLEEYEDEIIKTEIIDPEDANVDGMSVTLLPHQVSGVKFLTSRESIEFEKGGLLCDDMGLGKTIQALALICKNKPTASDLESVQVKQDLAKNGSRDEKPKKPLRRLKSTLIICPVALANQWQDETTTKAPGLSSMVFHGPNRTTDWKELNKFDVVISTYATVSSEFSKENSPLYKGIWWRIILDEAHTIKNKKSKTAEATYNLNSFRRWCLTGTLIQNNLDELQSLFTFLRISRYSNTELWNQLVGKLIKSGKAVKAFNLLRNELREIMLRRTKASLSKQSAGFKLPPKNVHRVEIEFSKHERKLYKSVQKIILREITGTKTHADHTESDEYDLSKLSTKVDLAPIKRAVDSGNVSYMCALVYLLRLRQICCSWKLIFELNKDDLSYIANEGSVSKMLESPIKKNTTAKVVADEFDDLAALMGNLSVGIANCEICMSILKPEEAKFCTTCQKVTAEKTENLDDSSAKIKKLISILKKDPERKTIVFSQFTTVLNLLDPILTNEGFKCVAYDGSMHIKKRDAALNELRNDPDTTVLLCSLKCGSVGLNLTCASQVVLFDPWWNPQIQEQAIDRVYRIGQTKPVDIFELTIKDSIEENILKLQDKKRHLAKAITDGDSISKSQLVSGKLSQTELLQLFGVQ